MKFSKGLAIAPALLFASQAEAVEASMRRGLSCTGPDAKIEIYLQEAEPAGQTDAKIAGWYALDLSGVGKGKTLEPIRLQYSRDRKAVIIDQYTRKLPPTRIAVTGGTVDFDQRFATGAKCGPFNQE